MDRCSEISPFCARFKITKAECLALLGRYQEAEMCAKLVDNFLKLQFKKKNNQA